MHTGKIYRYFAKIINDHNIENLNNLDLIIPVLLEIKKINYCARLDSEEIGKIASQISQIKEVRNIADEFQFSFIRNHKHSVIEGRDIGTVICPEAQLKIFLQSSSQERAKRRHSQLINGQSINSSNYQEVLAQIELRDQNDQTRAISPLKPAADAIIIDNSNIALMDVVDMIIKLYQERI